MAQAGYLVLFDLSGYTAFSVHSGLEEGAGIIGSLFGTFLEHIEPPLQVAELEGDAVFAWAPAGAFRRGQTFVELLENLYCVFAATREQMTHNATCGCSGCRSIPQLDLKVVAHYGNFVPSRVAPGHGRAKPTGPAVILAHRLLKNRITERTGVRSYAYITDACIDALGIDWLGDKAERHTETYDHMGEVGGRVYDLAPAWAADRESRLANVSREETWLEVSVELDASTQEVWDLISTPGFRNLWHGATRTEQSGGRAGPGTVSRCYRGESVRIETIVEWQPFRLLTMDCEWSGGTQVRTTLELAAAEGVTRLVARLGRPRVTNLRGVAPMLLYRSSRPTIVRQCQARLDWVRSEVGSTKTTN